VLFICHIAVIKLNNFYLVWLLKKSCWTCLWWLNGCFNIFLKLWFVRALMLWGIACWIVHLFLFHTAEYLPL